jgi:hypothetical protein
LTQVQGFELPAIGSMNHNTTKGARLYPQQQDLGGDLWHEQQVSPQAATSCVWHCMG